HALAPPIASIVPPSLHIVVPRGSQQSGTLTLSNGGGSALTFSVESSLPTSAVPAVRAPAPPAPEKIVTTGKPSAAATKGAARAASALVAAPGPQSIGNVLVIADGGTETDVDSALVAAGYAVTQIGDDSFWAGNNPSPAGFKLIVLLDGPAVSS